MATETLVQRLNKKRLEDGEEDLKTLEQVEEEELNLPPELTDEEKSWEKRYGDLRRFMSKKEAEWKKKFEEVSTKVAQPKIEMPASTEELEAWKQKYPQVAAIVESIALSRAEEIADRKFAEAKLDLDNIRLSTEEVAKEKALAAIRKKHEDFDDIVDDNSFWDWVDTQPTWVNDFMGGNDPTSIVRVIDLYKSDSGLTKTDAKEREKNTARLVKTKGKTAVADKTVAKYTESQVQAMSAKQYAAEEDKIMEAIQKGEFVYDISGGAR